MPGAGGFSYLALATLQAIHRLLVVGGVVLAQILLAPAASASSPVFDPAAVYQVACAPCHGVSGRVPEGDPMLQHFKNVPADFTDPLFNSREPASDWFLVTKHGGPSLALSSQMPSFAEAFSDEEISALVAYVKQFPEDRGYPPGDLNFFLPIRTIKAFPEDEVVLKMRYQDTDGVGSWRNIVELEKRIGRRHQVTLELIHEIEDDDGSLAEMELGWKTALTWSLPRQFILSGGANLAFPFAANSQVEAIPYLALGKGLSDSFTLQASARSHVPTERFEDGDFEASAIIHCLTTVWPRGVFPAFEVTAKAPFDPGDGDAVQVSLTPQLHFGLSRGGHVRLNTGVEIPVSRRDYDFRVHAMLIWDFADGWFWKRW
ncbi:MAG: cytochrome c [Verrucomicrobia bacterium]|nr:cytochrome c [Verrucomicrobiota bacterium]